MLGSRGCLGCCTNPPLIISMDEPFNRRSQGQAVKKEHISDDFWSSDTFEMDPTEVQSQRSIPTIGVSNQPSDPQSSTVEEINPPEFVNHGLLLWNQIRQEWIGNRRSQTESQRQAREPRISWNATYESLLGSNKPFGHPIPLGEMVDFLVDIWEQEGLYD
ncbi:hypothetical protein L6164_024315 [Bauhinia variegata]|uniref:Uncharacterized protein n=1 Tax=Bauhinia variegata TaxID=167791 RepID=A0ACB9LXD7_BAUVA|nr:hypothetical protein L6164_024315 [Bauhinia variegata]